MKAILSVALATVVAAGCSVGPRYQAPQIELPTELRGAAEPAPAAGDPTASLADRSWWELFGDPVLAALIDQALREGHDVRLAAWRVEEARAAAGIAASSRLPAVSAGAGWSRGRSPLVGPETFDQVDVQLGVSWEIDLWGRLRHLDEAARARYLASEEAQRGVMLSLVGDVATTYFHLRALDLELDIARRSAEAFAQTHSLFETRLEAGLASGLETSSAEALQAAAAASIPDLERQIVAQENRLAVLLGHLPTSSPRGAALDAQMLPPEVPAGLPADLLQRRPDLRQAEQELIAANAEVGVAVAEMFPTLRLTGLFGGVAPEVSDLLSAGKNWSVGGGLLSPLFQGQQLSNQRRAAVARWEQAKVRYEASVTRALAETSTALVAYQELAKVEREQERSVDASRAAVHAANARYLSGLADYLEVLQAQRQLFPAELARTRTRFERLATLVEIYQALGGGWQLADDAWSAPQPSSTATTAAL